MLRTLIRFDKSERRLHNPAIVTCNINKVLRKVIQKLWLIPTFIEFNVFRALLIVKCLSHLKRCAQTNICFLGSGHATVSGGE